MKTMCPPGYHRNGFVATHALRHIVFMIAYIYIYNIFNIYIYIIYYIIYIYIYMYKYIYIYIYMYIFTSYSHPCTKKKFFIKDFFSKCDQIRSFPRIWLHLLKQCLMENFIFVQ